MTIFDRAQDKSGLKIEHRQTLGTVTVEMAIVAPILAVLLFGIIEFGFLFRDVLGLRQAAREGVRIAAAGATTTEIIDRIESSSPLQRTEQFDISLEYRLYASGWGEWYTLGDIGSGSTAQNNAPSGAQVRVAIDYPHPLVTGGLFSGLADSPDSQTVTLRTQAVMRRE